MPPQEFTRASSNPRALIPLYRALYRIDPAWARNIEKRKGRVLSALLIARTPHRCRITSKRQKQDKAIQKAKGTNSHSKRIAERAKESHTQKRKHNSDSEDELETGSKAACRGSDSETVSKTSDSSSDSGAKEREELAEDTQTLEKEQSEGQQLKASIRAQKETNKKG